MNKYQNIIIDTTNLFWRITCRNLKKKISSNVYVYQNIIPETFKEIKNLKQKFGYNDSNIYCCFDNPLSAINTRKMLSNGKYKSSRDKSIISEGLYKIQNIFIELLEIYISNNWYICQEDELEADDLVEPLLDFIKPEDKNKVLLISNDMDWARGIEEFIHWYNYIDIYNLKNFKKKYNFSPQGNAVKMYKAIHGDISDCIPNVIPYLPKEILLKIVENYQNIKKLIDNLWYLDYIPLNWKKKIKESEIKLLQNYQLVDYQGTQKDINIIIRKCKENLNLLKYKFQLYKIPLEFRMKDKNEKYKGFLNKKSYKLTKKFY